MSIEIYDLAEGRLVQEQVPAEAFMRFLYGNAAGRFFVWALFKRAVFSRICGSWADSDRSARAVKKFIEKNGINVDEFERDPKKFETFNEFFTRALRPDARPVFEPENKNAISFPCDGRHMLFENVDEADSFYAKGQRFNLQSFLGDASLAKRFCGGDMLVSRLSPLDYHRFHYPVSGQIVARKPINGALYSVSPIALVPRISVFWENKRVLNLIDSKAMGLCAFVEIGATNVGTIVNFDKIDSYAKRGEQAGMFKFGASCVATLFPKSAKIRWNEKLKEMSTRQTECYAKVGTLAGVIE